MGLGRTRAALDDYPVNGCALNGCTLNGCTLNGCTLMRRSFTFLLRPTKKQEAALSTCLEDTRQLYNAALEERREAWRMGRHRVTFYSQDAQLKETRAADPERCGRWSFWRSLPQEAGQQSPEEGSREGCQTARQDQPSAPRPCPQDRPHARP